MTSTLSQIIHRRQFIITALATTACATARKNTMEVDEKSSPEEFPTHSTTNKIFLLYFHFLHSTTHVTTIPLK